MISRSERWNVELIKLFEILFFKSEVNWKAEFEESVRHTAFKNLDLKIRFDVENFEFKNAGSSKYKLKHLLKRFEAKKVFKI